MIRNSFTHAEGLDMYQDTNIPDTIYLDADDTLLDWSQTAMERLRGHRDISGVTEQYNPALFGAHTTGLYFARLMADPDFWDSLEVTPLGERLLEAARILPQQVIVVTNLPPMNHTSDPKLNERMISTAAMHKAQLAAKLGVPVMVVSSPPAGVWANAKAAIAGPRKLLVDDSPRIVAAFTAAGGQAIMTPQPWNDATADPVDLLMMLCEGIEGLDFPRPEKNL